LRYRFVLEGVHSLKALEPIHPTSHEVKEGSTVIEVDVVDDAHLQGVIELVYRLGAHVEGFQEIDVFREA